MASYQSAYALGDLVYMDNCASIRGVVTAFCWRVENPQVEVSWFNSGSSISAWFPEWRLSKDKPNG